MKVGHLEERTGLPGRDGLKRGIEFFGHFGLRRQQRDTELPRRGLYLSPLLRGVWPGRVPQDRHAIDGRHHLLQELEELAHDLRTREEGQSRNVPAWSREARGEAAPDGIARRRHDDSDRGRRVPGGRGRQLHPGEGDVDVEPDELARELRQPIGSPLRRAVLDHEVLALDPSERTKALAERGAVIFSRAPELQGADAVDLPSRLRLGGERRGEDPE
jgi:hypothetical protein